MISPTTYPSGASLVAEFKRYCVFAVSNTRHQVSLLALDSEHAEVEGANHLELSRNRVHVLEVPGFLQTRGCA